MRGYRTYVAIIVAMAPSIASIFGYHITPEFNEKFPELTDQLVTVLAGAAAFYYRARAETPGFLSK